jgi:hypothetical protein
MHHCGGIRDATVVAVSEGGDVAFPHVLDHLEEVGLDVELGGFAGSVGQEGGRARFRLLQGVVVTTFGAVSGAIGFRFEQFVGKDTIAPAPVS